MQTPEQLRASVKSRFIEYLKASGAPYYEPELTVCPICGKEAQIVTGTYWNCRWCKRHGDVVDYVQAVHHYPKEIQAIKQTCRVLGVRIEFFDTISGNDLMDLQLPESDSLVERLIGKGLYLLAGASKIGKSWLVLWMAHCISLGLPIWERKTRKCGVLYLSLEDTYERLQQRLVDLSGGETGELDLVTEAELLGSGLENQITNFLQDHADTGLIIIDTLQKVRQLRADSYSYAGDYATLTALKQLADRFGITILLVHHTRKQEADDSVDKISGTTGLAGCADGFLILEKESRMGTRGTLVATSRNYPDQKLLLNFDRERKIWVFLGYDDAGEEEPEDPILKAVSQFFANTGNWRGTATELLDGLHTIDPTIDAKPNTLTRRLNAKTKELRQRYHIRYTHHRTEAGKYIRLENLYDMTDMNDILECTPTA